MGVGYVFHCTPCGFAHAGECEKEVCPTCPAGFCHGKLHHNWEKQGHPLIDLWNTYWCSQCKTTIKRSAVDVIANVPTQAWAGPCGTCSSIGQMWHLPCADLPGHKGLCWDGKSNHGSWEDTRRPGYRP